MDKLQTTNSQDIYILYISLNCIHRDQSLAHICGSLSSYSAHLNFISWLTHPKSVFGPLSRLPSCLHHVLLRHVGGHSWRVLAVGGPNVCEQRVAFADRVYSAGLLWRCKKAQTTAVRDVEKKLLWSQEDGTSHVMINFGGWPRCSAKAEFCTCLAHTELVETGFIVFLCSVRVELPLVLRHNHGNHTWVLQVVNVY